jgi:hypothetical protein
MFGSLLILLVLPKTDLSVTRGSQFRPLMKLLNWFFVVNFFILMWIGSQHPETPFVEIGQFATFFYFSFFLFLVPIVGILEKSMLGFMSKKINNLDINNHLWKSPLNLNISKLSGVLEHKWSELKDFFYGLGILYLTNRELQVTMALFVGFFIKVSSDSSVEASSLVTTEEVVNTVQQVIEDETVKEKIIAQVKNYKAVDDWAREANVPSAAEAAEFHRNEELSRDLGQEICDKVNTEELVNRHTEVSRITSAANYSQEDIPENKAATFPEQPNVRIPITLENVDPSIEVEVGISHVREDRNGEPLGDLSDLASSSSEEEINFSDSDSEINSEGDISEELVSDSDGEMKLSSDSDSESSGDSNISKSESSGDSNRDVD